MSRSFPGTAVDAETAGASSRRGSRPFVRSGPWFAAFLLLAVVAFWPTYLSRLGASSAYTHFHALTATVWMSLLIVQPVLIRTRRLDLHRAVGRASFVFAPVMVGGIILLAHSGIRGLEGGAFAGQSYLLYLQISLAVLFTLCYGAAVATRRRMHLHARFMVGTAFTLIDPVTVRLLLWADSSPSWNYQWLTFGLTDAVILGLIWMERDAPRGRWVFPTLLGIFVAAQLPALLGLTGSEAWQAFARWFAELSLT